MINKQSVLVYDIETRPILAYVWGLKDQNIGLNQIVKDWSVMAWGAKWLGEPASKTMYMDTRKRSEREILGALWVLLNRADIVITQNGQNFDSPKLNARFIQYGMIPPKPYRHLDTYQIIKRAAQFTSNKLEYLTDKLCTKYKKLSHSKYPGMALWTECLNGNNDAWEEMKKYNIHDVLSTEELYNRIRAWAPQNAPKVYLEPTVCSVCGSKHTERRGYDTSKKGKYPKIHCLDCGRWTVGDRIKESK